MPTLVDQIDERLDNDRFLRSQNPRVDEDAPNLAEELRGARTTRWLAMPADAIAPALDRIAKQSEAAADLTRRVGLILAKLPGVPFDDAAKLVGVSPAKLTSWLHGKESVASSRAQRLEQVNTILVALHEVLEPAATNGWLHVSIPDLHGMTPLEAAEKGKLQAVVDVARSYIQPSYS